MPNRSPESGRTIAALQFLPIAVFVAGPDGVISSVNAALTALTGFTAADLIGQDAAFFAGDGAKDRFRQVILRVAEDGQPAHGDWEVRKQTGHSFRARLAIAPIADGEGGIQGLVATMQDITAQQAAEEEAAEARRDFERFFNLIPELAVIAHTDGHFKKLNPFWERTLGYTIEEGLNTPFLEFIHPDDVAASVAEIAKQSATYRTDHFVNRYRCKNGSYRVFEWTTTFNRDESTRFGVARDITEQRLSEESLRESEERFRIMADSCPTIIWVTGVDGGTRLANRMCQEFFGTLFEQADSEQARRLIHPGDYPDYAGKFLRAVSERSPFRAEARVRRSDGEWRWIESHGEPRFSSGGEFLGHVGISPDITDRKRGEEALRKAKEDAENANRAKSEFVANMSHEIRTPMNAVIGLTDLTLETELSTEQRGYLEGVKNSADSLLRLLNDILDFSKIEAGKLEFERIEFEPRRSVEAMLKGLGVRAAAKGLELACYFAPDVPRTVLGDAGRLRQILVNLIGNAIKFTDKGEVVIGVARLSETADEVELHCSVTDTGIGIAAGKQGHVFHAFVQADSSLTRRFGGTGLGLAISSQLVELMGGRIWVESEEGRGSTFQFTARFGVAGTSPVEPVEFGGLRALVAGGGATSRKILGMTLSHWGFLPVLTDSGAAAYDALTQAVENGNPFAVALLDADLPDIDGFVLAERIATDARLRGLATVMLTTGMRRGDGGAPPRLTKPVGEPELLDTLRRLLHPSRPAIEPVSAASRGATETDRILRFLLVEDSPVNRLLATRLIERRNHTVIVAENGKEALDCIAKEPFDCVLMDVQMPVMDGFEATAAIRSQERNSGGHLAIIAMTAHAMAGDLERCLACGMDGYISKPINARELFATVERVLLELQSEPGNVS